MVTRQRRWGFLGFWVGIATLAMIRHFFTATWPLRDDDGTWFRILYRWCDGGRLYADIWETKPPLFFLALRPFCSAPRTEGVLSWHQVLPIWGPLLFIFGVTVDAFVRVLRLSSVSAWIFGLLASVLFWNGNYQNIFSSEWIALGFVSWILPSLISDHPNRGPKWSWGLSLSVTAAVLCNWRFVTFYVLYLPHFAPMRWNPRWFIRDFLSSLGLVGLVLFFTVGRDPVAFHWLGMGIHPDTYPDSGLTSALLRAWRDVISGRSLDLIFLTPFGVSGGGWTRALAAVAAAGGIGWLVLRRHWMLLGSASLSWAMIYLVALPCDHAYVTLLPYLLAVMATLLLEAKTRVSRLILNWGICILIGVAFVHEVQGRTTNFASERRFAETSSFSLIRDEVTSGLRGENWISILRHEPAIFLNGGLKLPANRLNHNYCIAGYPSWAKQENEALILTGEYLLALDTALGAPGCLTAPTIALAQAKCALVKRIPYDSLETPGAAIEIRDCRVLRSRK